MTDELPNGWATAKLADVVDVLDGRRVPVNARERASRPGDIPYYGATGQVGWIDDHLFDEDLILLGEDGVQFFDPTKPKAYLISGRAWVNNHAHVLRAHEQSVDRRFLCYYLNHFNYEGFVNGTTRLKLTQGAMNQIPILLPPLAEQRRVIETLEDHLSRLDAACSIVRANLRRCQAMEAAVIDQAVRGLLVNHDSTDEIGPYVQGLSGSRRSMTGGRSIPKPTSSSLAMSIPTNWTTKSVDEITWSIEYGTSAKAHSEPAPSDVPVIRMGNIQNRELDFTSLKYLSSSHPDVQKLSLTDGDILFNRTNSAELVGKSAVYRSDCGPATFASYLIRCRVLPEVESDWLNLVINSPVGRAYLSSVVSQQVGQANINGTKLATMPIPLPTQQEQRAILEVVDDYLGKHKRLTKALTSSLQRAEHLRKALLSRTFAGELVSQDPTEEPAIEVLKRTEAERRVRIKTTRAQRTSAVPPRQTKYVSVGIQEELPL
ncbi:restriction endonuclease subunit S [Asanoa sp. NPDC050611]|uniref:restriction endonuclease subunit S n=1 Tax=Asanoa sp. NPDC050611 TaxID=3157098 RepID=UPI0033D33FB7